MKNMPYQTLDIIEEITRNDGSIYFELGNINHNARAEKAAILGQIKNVRILKMNINQSQDVKSIEQFINENYEMPSFEEWLEWVKPSEIEDKMMSVLNDNHVA